MLMTQFLEKYGEELVRFRSYYKYSFTYIVGSITKAISEPHLLLTVGGDHDNIYRADLKAEMTVQELLSETGSEYLLVLIDGHHEDIVEDRSF